jgi:hypothetical protein
MNAKRDKGNFFENITLLDKRRATKFVIYGLIVAILFGLMMMISRSIAQNASSWQNLANQENYMNYQNGVYGYNDYIEQQQQITTIRYWMEFQDAIFMNIARVGVNIAMIFIVIGFLSFALNQELDERSRRICLIIAGLILFVVMFTTFFASISISVA